jgi:ribonuclease P protein component
MSFTYPTSEKLKSRKTIEVLFTAGKSVSVYPLRLVFVPVEQLEDTTLQMGVSVSKRYFKKAVDRNYFKRLLRESYRLNKNILHENLEQKYAVMLLYQTKDRLSFQDVEAKTKLLFEKFLGQLELRNK